MKSVTLSSKNQIVIPSAARLKLGVKSGDKLMVMSVTDKEIILKKQPGYHGLVGTLPEKKTDAVRRVRDLRSDWQ